MNKLLVILLLSPVIVFPLASPAYSQFDIFQITHNSYADEYVRINNNGNLVWEGWDSSEVDIFLWDGTSITNVSDNDIYDSIPEINDNGWVVWVRGIYGVICVCLGNSVVELIDDDFLTMQNPQINNSGNVVWWGLLHGGASAEIFHWDGSFPVTDHITQITNNSYTDAYPFINDNGEVIWEAQPDGGGDWEIFYWDGSFPVTERRITNNDYDDHVGPASQNVRTRRINNHGEAVWKGNIGTVDGNAEVFYWDGTVPPGEENIVRITDDNKNDLHAWINDRGQIVWEKASGVYIWDKKNPIPRKISDTAHRPQINNNGYMVYEYGGGGIMLYNGRRRIQVSDSGSCPQINDNEEIAWHDSDGTDLEIFFAEPRPGGYSSTANAQASTCGSNSLTASGTFNELILLFIPVAAVIVLRFWRST